MFYLWLGASVFFLVSTICQILLCYLNFGFFLTNIMITLTLFITTGSLVIKKIYEEHKKSILSLVLSFLFLLTSITYLIITIFNHQYLLLNLSLSLIMFTISFIIFFYYKKGYTKEVIILNENDRSKDDLVFEVVYEIEQLLSSDFITNTPFEQTLLNCEESMFLVNKLNIGLRSSILLEVINLLRRYSILNIRFEQNQKCIEAKLKIEESIMNFTNSLDSLLN